MNTGNRKELSNFLNFHTDKFKGTINLPIPWLHHWHILCLHRPKVTGLTGTWNSVIQAQGTPGGYIDGLHSTVCDTFLLRVPSTSKSAVECRIADIPKATYRHLSENSNLMESCSWSHMELYWSSVKSHCHSGITKEPQMCLSKFKDSNISFLVLISST